MEGALNKIFVCVESSCANTEVLKNKKEMATKNFIKKTLPQMYGKELTIIHLQNTLIN